jgi:ribosomal protein S6
MPKAENEEKNEAQLNTDSRVYELGYLLVPSITEENLPATYGNLRELVASFKGEIISDEMPKMMPLAYGMSKVLANTRHKFNTAYFGWIKFVMDSENVPELKKKLDLDLNLIRFLIMKTVKENTIASKRFVRGEMHRKPRAEKNGENETAMPINKEEIDKEIDALIAV